MIPKFISKILNYINEIQEKIVQQNCPNDDFMIAVKKSLIKTC